MKNQSETTLSQRQVTAAVTASVTGITPPPETGPTLPSEADLFRREGEGLGVGMKKGNVPLDAIIYYVQRTANLDDLNLILPTCGAP